MAGAGYRDWVAGDVPTATQFDTYLQEQTVMRFADAAARDTALSTAKAEGMVCYLVDTNTITVYSGSAWSTIGPVHGALLTWTATITQSGTVTNSPSNTRYSRVGRRITGNGIWSITGSGSASNVITLTLPVTAVADNMVIGTGYLTDASTGVVYPFNVLSTGSGVSCYGLMTSGNATVANGTVGSSGSGATFNAALASGDTLVLGVSYEAAADA